MTVFNFRKGAGMKNVLKRLPIAIGVLFVFFTGVCGAATASAPVKTMTLWKILVSGGPLMLVLALFSMIALALVIYDFICFKPEKICPEVFYEKALNALTGKKFVLARQMCEAQTHLLADMVKIGLQRRETGRMLIRESMENCARAQIDALWQNISYLSDIAVIAPLVGLLGTVVGMIQAFNTLAVQATVVKPILLSAGVSTAMVATAGGLTVAIPVLAFHAILRGKVQRITNVIENYTADLVKVMEEI
jgi:biopolymer transport protein ExbB